MCNESYMSQVFKRLHLHKSFQKRLAVTYGTMVLEKDRIVFRQERAHTVRQFIRSRSCISSQRNSPDRHNGFLTESFVEGAS